MFGVLGVGIWTGDLGIAVNAGVGLLATFLPAVLDRDLDVTMDAGLVLWIAVAMFLHAFGTLPLPGLGFSTLYSETWWWDHVTHTLSASLVAGVAYTAARAVDDRSEAIHFPPQFLFAYLLVFVVAFGVLWELLEFYITVVSGLIGDETILTQYGLDDTVLDIVYDTLGGVLVAAFGAAHLNGLSDQLVARFEERQTGR
ncbi:hypothetical protein [Halosimplex marinum]|uniref:hypothetical protein n=1 Tax=Halosimplex marinum TaxID=3396620 RepID=UPI003F549958